MAGRPRAQTQIVPPQDVALWPW